MKAYLQLVRLPNLFTAAADSLAGWLLVEGTFQRPERWLLLVAASTASYAGGIVLNDVCDLAIDKIERPGRPLPSGRVGLKSAMVLAVSLLGLGLILACASRTRFGPQVAVNLIALVVVYDVAAKRSPLGPPIMGACRGSNLLLGMSDAPQLGGPGAWLIAVSYGLFVSGVTWISRSEVGERSRGTIIVGIIFENLALLGLVIVGPEMGGVPALWAVAGLVVLFSVWSLVNRGSLRAFRTPEPAVVQRAVKLGILSLVWLHVGVLLTVRGPGPAFAVGWLWLPAVYAGRWVYST
jgi:4-hydroxybenzoate polyprenyltransferase